MKQPPKPFAIEIKRSRRPATAAAPADFFGKDSSVLNSSGLNGADSGFFSRRDSLSNRTSASEPAVPAFLQNEATARRTSFDQASKEAAQIFTPRPAEPSGEGLAPQARQPRILPSLVPPEGAALDALTRTEAPPRAARQGRGLDASARKPRGAAKKDRAAKSDRNEKIKAPAKLRASEAAPANATEIRPERKPAAAWGAASAPPSPAPRAAQNAAEGDGAQPGGNWRGARVRGLTRRGREDAAALPPGQHWKRRLNPRAW